MQFSLITHGTRPKKTLEFIYNFLSYPADRQRDRETDRQTDTGYNMSSLAEVITSWLRGTATRLLAHEFQQLRNDILQNLVFCLFCGWHLINFILLFSN